MESVTGYFGAAAGIYGIFVTPLFIIWCISLCTARRKGDPARVGVAWMKAVFPFWMLASAFLTIGAGLRLWVRLADDSSSFDYDEDVVLAVALAAEQVWNVGLLFFYISNIAILVCFAEFANGFLLVLTGANRFAKPIRFTALGFAFLFFILTIAFFGLVVKWNNDFYDYQRNPRSTRAQSAALAEQARVVDRMGGATTILIWLASFPAVGYASLVVHKAKTVPHLRNSAVLLLVATILNFIRMTAELGATAAYGLGNPPATRVPFYVPLVVLPVFHGILFFVLLVLLFVIGIRKQKGLWSNQQPLLQPQMAPTAVPYVLPYGTVPQQPPVVWQGQQPIYPPAPQGVAAYPQQPQQPQQQQVPPSGYPASGYPHSGYPHSGYPQQPQQPQPVQAYPPQQVVANGQEPQQKAPGVSEAPVS